MVLAGCVCVVTIVPVGVVCVVCVVVVTGAEAVMIVAAGGGADGGGDDRTCDCGSETQPAKSTNILPTSGAWDRRKFNFCETGEIVCIR
jgi:hypothetical protein